MCGETEARGTTGFGPWEPGWLQVRAEGDSWVVLQGTNFPLKQDLEWQGAERSHPLPIVPVCPGRATPCPVPVPPFCPVPRRQGPRQWAQPCLICTVPSPRLASAATPSPPSTCPSSRRSSWTKTKVRGWAAGQGLPALQHLAWGMASASSAAARAACIPRGRTTAGAACEIQAVKGPW